MMRRWWASCDRYERTALFVLAVIWILSMLFSYWPR